MNNSKLLYLIPVFLLLMFSCQNDDNTSNNNSCDGHLECCINGEFREANCNFNEEGYGADDFIIKGIDLNNGTNTYFISASESVGLDFVYDISFTTENALTQATNITTDFPSNLTSGQRISAVAFNNLDPDTSLADGLVSSAFALDGSNATININNVDGQFISGTFDALIIFKHPITNQVAIYEVTDGIFESVYLEPY